MGYPIKLKRFQKLLLNNPHLSPTECAARIYNCKDRKSAGNIASENLEKLGITFKKLMIRMGLSDEQDVADLIRLRNAKKVQSCDLFVKDENGKLTINKNSNDFIEVDDNATQLKALELTMKLKNRIGGEEEKTINQVNLIQVIKNFNGNGSGNGKLKSEGNRPVGEYIEAESDPVDLQRFGDIEIL